MTARRVDRGPAGPKRAPARAPGRQRCRRATMRSSVVDEFVDVGDTRLQEVATSFAAADQIGRLLELDVRGQHDDRGVRQLRSGSRAPRPVLRSCGSAACGCRRSPSRASRSVRIRAEPVASPLCPTTSNPRPRSRLAIPSRRRTSSSARTTAYLGHAREVSTRSQRGASGTAPARSLVSLSGRHGREPR